MPNWRKLDRRARPTPGKPTVGIQGGGRNLSLNRAAVEALGSPEAVELLYDPDESLIGIRAAPKTVATFPVVGLARGASTCLIAATALVKAMGIDAAEAKRYDAQMIDDILTVDLKTGVSASRGPARRGGAGFSSK